MTITNILTFELGFSRKDNLDGELETMQFSVYYDKSRYEDVKEVVIEHCNKIKNIDDGFVNFAKYVPVFKTLKVLNDRVPSDLGLR